MANLRNSFSLALLLSIFFVQIEAQEIKRVDHVAGFIIYRSNHGDREYLLLKHAKNGKWAPPKGNQEGGESLYETAVRETKEDTGLSPSDYLQPHGETVDFEYLTDKNILKKVTLWVAELKNPWQPIEINEEEEEAYAWLDFYRAYEICTEDYKDGLKRGEQLAWSSWSRSPDEEDSGSSSGSNSGSLLSKLTSALPVLTISINNDISNNNGSLTGPSNRTGLNSTDLPNNQTQPIKS